jgi:two-component system, OmpR family, response regulator
VEVREFELRFADLVLNEATHEVWRGDELVDLTPREFDLLRFFLLNPRRVLSKQQILDRVWDESFGGDPNIVETYVSYLRRKLDRHGPPLIHTVRFVGYALREAAA